MLKIYDYSKPLVGITTKIHQKILWPCYEYTIGIKGLSISGNNMLEMLILNLAGEKCIACETVANATGLETDLIIFLQERLIHKGLLTNLYEISQDGKAVLSDIASKESNRVLYKLYRDGISGELLPHLILQGQEKRFSYQEYEIKNMEDEDIPAFFYYKENASAGTEDNVPKEIPLFQCIKEHPFGLPMPDQIGTLLKNRYSNTLASDFNIFLPIISEKTESNNCVYFVVEIVLQKGNSVDWLITNPFGDGISPTLTQSVHFLPKKTQKHIRSLRSKIDEKVLRDASYQYPKELSPIMKKWERFPQIGEKLDKLIDLLPISDMPQNSNEVNTLEEKKCKAILLLYQILEWAFFYRLKNDNNTSSTLHYLKKMGQNPWCMKKIVLIQGKKMGFKLKDLENRFFIKYNSIYHAIHNTPELFALCSLALACSKHNPEHWMYKQAKKNPDLFEKFNTLKVQRDTASHSGTISVSKQYIEQNIQFVEEWLKTLFMESTPTGTSNKQDVFEIIEEEMSLNTAIGSLEEKLGLYILSGLNEHTKSILIKMEKCVKDNFIDPQIVLFHYMILETLFSDMIFKNRKSCNAFSAEQALQKACKNGFDSGNTLLKALRSTSEKKIENALKGKYASMQACCIAWLLVLDDSFLKEIAQKNKKLIFWVNRVVELRKHGEIPKTGTDNKELEEITNVIVELIKYLGTKEYLN